ncbi:hypothetical protein ACFU9Y_39320 [Streptomyces sp. NPDC057621]|uniref:hypothetical protein n=1 Tax=Streptomyces sp. NPDC057621 TaxID=3346186 RepID=UPI0036BCF574
MSTPPRPLLKSITTTPPGPADAPQPVDTPAAGEPKCVAEGVPSAVLPDPQTGDDRYPVAWLRITAPRGATPTATSKCLCGLERRAFGRRRVLALITEHTEHRDACPLRTPREGRAAA